MICRFWWPDRDQYETNAGAISINNATHWPLDAWLGMPLSDDPHESTFHTNNDDYGLILEIDLR